MKTSGNTTRDALNRSFVYDGENKQIEVLENNVSLGKYFYDGDGKRVKKITANETVIFVYDAIGKLIAEYSTQLSQTPQVAYLTNDHLGSPRINTDALGSVISRHDYQPFGEEIERASYGTDDIRKQFTGYERDKETDLDFAQARMYNKNHGRFTTTDPLAASANSIRPQSWNRYTYSYNNPHRFTDPSGMIPGDYVDEDGYVIGNDGKTDTKLYFVANEAEQRQVSENTRNGKSTDGATITSELELPGADLRREVGVNTVNRMNSPNSTDKDGKNHEEGGVAYPTTTGNPLIVPAAPGPTSRPADGAEINVFNPANPSLLSNATTLSGTTPVLIWHGHPSGTQTRTTALPGGRVQIDRATYEQHPSDPDIRNAGTESHRTQLGYLVVVAAGKREQGGQKVYFYNGTGVLGSMTIDGFVNAGRTRR